MPETAPNAAAPNRPFQFSLKMLLAFTALVALCCAIFVWIGWVGLGYVSIIVFGYVAYNCLKAHFLAVFLLYAVIPLTLLGTFVSVSNPRGFHETDSGNMCRNNLWSLGKAITSYETRHHEFPPNVFAGINGQQVYSWRVRLIGSLGLAPVWDEYHTNESWNSPNNRKWSEHGANYWHCPSDRDALPETTNYLAVVGPHTAWSPDRALTKADFPDGLENTILLVEIPNSGIHWMEPRDITVWQFRAWFQKLKDEPDLAPHSGGMNVLMGDGQVRSLPLDLKLETLDALLTRDGGEQIDLDKLD